MLLQISLSIFFLLISFQNFYAQETLISCNKFLPKRPHYYSLCFLVPETWKDRLQHTISKKKFHFESCTGKNRKRNLLVFLAIRIQRVTQAGYSLVYRLRKYSFRKIQKFLETKTMVRWNFSRCPLEWSHSTICSVPHSSRIYCPETHSSKI